jgi:glycosyltransferase involved in cell wall biosynthesis
MPLVSVIFGPGKGTPFAVEAVESLIAQTYRDWELILAGDFGDAFSRSFPIGWSERFPDRLIVLDAAEPASGWAALRNRCACRARGKYLAFLDPDDVWLPERLSSQLDPQEVVALAYTGLVEIGAHGVTHTSAVNLSSENQRAEVLGSMARWHDRIRK